ncbi:carbohydrate ABC transporter permease [Deinococcus yavapaiensis]|uniref:Carbohydrate ABC transporter membrane protein 1 (CUT1 family) n=1 Tax=Deinococcus yavapaiensis KR-236 TaxID=694435 RepID=A0A318S7K7_9DEIO|nr:sugar ABC transporter permease [Deinococcus yavapaiensis]PYE51011.1 carbohydrate ABC transporter membrane protein 1 (CUT1 family) [Deinococcus yavapaiensis KR-236]
MDRTLRDWRAILFFVGPAMLLYGAVLLVPILWSLGYTVFEGSPIAGFKFVGFDNYARLAQDPTFWKALWFGTKYALFVSAGQVIFGLLLALLYAFYLKRSSVLVRTLVFLPVVLPTVAIAQMFAKLFAIAPQYGLVNSVLANLGLDSLVQAWLGQGDTAFWIIGVMDIWKAMGFYAILLYTGLVDIPEDVIEAARLDGAQGWALSRFVVLPLLAPITVASLIFSLNGTLKVFDSIMALTGGGPGTATTPLTLYMYKTSFTYGEYGYGSTLALTLAVQCLLVTLLIFWRSRRAGGGA